MPLYKRSLIIANRVFATIFAFHSCLILYDEHDKLTVMQNVWTSGADVISMCIMHYWQSSPNLFPALYSLQNLWTLPAMLTERGASRLL